LRKSSLWAEAHDAELRRLVAMGSSAARLHVHFKKPMVNILKRARALGLTIKKPTRLRSSERISGNSRI
jgi:hypothetical protein